MLIIDKPKVASFARRYLAIFTLAVAGWELSQFATSGTKFDLKDLLEAVVLFTCLFLAAVLTASFFQGWIEFRPDGE